MPSSSDASTPPERCFQQIPGNPEIRKLTFLGGLPQQPQTLRFKVDWEDNNSDLRGGSSQFVVNGKEFVAQPLSSRTVNDGPRGSFELLLPLSARVLVPGTRIRVELLLKDEKGLSSNRPFFVLEVQKP